MAEYETCTMGIMMALEYQVKKLKVFGNSTLVIYHLRGEWETWDAKLVPYHDLVKEMIESFDVVTFHHVHCEENQMVDALATLSAMVQMNEGKEMTTPAPFIVAIDAIKTPTSVQESLKDENWVQAMKEEMEELEENSTWEIVDRPKDKRVIDCRWKRCTQTYGIDYEETFSPVAKMNTMLEDFQEIFPNDIPRGLPPIRGIEHQIDFTMGFTLLKRAAYKANPKENKRIEIRHKPHREVDENKFL
ncbi:putative mitochondrial protein, partial [Mucuna pruriens]